MQPSQEILNSLPYLVYSDFVKQIQELHELCDFLVVDLSEFTDKQGIKMLYRDSKSLVKLLSSVRTTRDKLLGKRAALEYEKFADDIKDPQCSVRSIYRSPAIISSNRATDLFLKIKSTKNNLKIASEAKRQNFKGVILRSDSEDFEADLKEIKNLSKLGL